MIRSRWGNRRVVLLGVGHTHAHIVRRWPQIAPTDTQLICVSDRPTATYSGMLPAVLAGQAPRSAMEIDLVRFCRAAGATLVIDAPIGIDHQRQELIFETRAPLAFDLLSIGIGSRPRLSAQNADTSKYCISIKPMQTFLDRLDVALESLFSQPAEARLQIAVVGGGVAGIEVILALHRRLGDTLPIGTPHPELILIDASSSFARELPYRARKALAGELNRRGIRHQSNFRVAKVLPQTLLDSTGQEIRADLVIWATGAAPPACFASWNLPLDPQGFIETQSTLQIAGFPRYFAVGDSASLTGLHVPKAGVYAVRQGPILEHNLLALCEDRKLIAYRPQRDFLRLINLADDSALAVRSGWVMRGRWAYRWKRRIDDGFMAMHSSERLAMGESVEFVDQVVTSHSMTANTSSRATVSVAVPTTPPMRCRGCGSKLDSTTLRSVLQRLGLEAIAGADDVAWIENPSGRSGWSIDYFPAPLDDPELAGRIAARHALTDLIAKGIQPQQALALIQVPELNAVGQHRILFESLSGAQREFARFGCRLIGGHTLAGPRLALGFTLLGHDPQTRPLSKRGIVAGDALLLTQPLGVGVVLAALDRALCPASTRESTLREILGGLHPQAVDVVAEHAHAATDVTGFGLAGHLAEMLGNSALSVVLNANQIPLLPGVPELSKQGISSSLSPDNQQLPIPIEILAPSLSPHTTAPPTPLDQQHCCYDSLTAYQVIFDPQTCGGLLLSVPKAQVSSVQRRFEDLKMRCWNIGTIEESRDQRPHLRWLTSLDPSTTLAPPMPQGTSPNP